MGVQIRIHTSICTDITLYFLLYSDSSPDTTAHEF